MDLFSFLSLHFMCVTVTVVTGHSVALSRRSHLVSTMSSLHDVLVHNSFLLVTISKSKVVFVSTNHITVILWATTLCL
jgi:hypothetical protein